MTVTAAEVTSMPQFRELFAVQALRPGEQQPIHEMFVMFTNFKPSPRTPSGVWSMYIFITLATAATSPL